MSYYLDASRRFLDRPLNGRSRLVLVLSAVVIAGAILVPLWRIWMIAPQYQDGLELTIYSHKLEAGNDGQDLDEINTLNHYIGMQPIREADFGEMQWIPFALGVFALLALRAAVFGRIRNVVDVGVLFLYFGAFSFYRFYYQLYTYAHNLDPKAPMNVEPFMPAVIGKNQIANFTQYSYPLWGSALLGVFLLLLAAAIWLSRGETLAGRNGGGVMNRLLALILLLAFAAGPLSVQPARAQPALQARLDAAASGDTLYVARGTHAGPLVIRTPLVLIGQEGAVIDGQGRGHVVEVRAPRVTVKGLTITGSGYALAEDHAGVMVQGAGAVIEGNRIRDALHGIYVKGAGGACIAGNDIRGKQATGAGRALPPAQRGNGIHLWKSVGNTVAGNTITGTRDGIYFSFADSTRAANNRIRGVRFGLHYMYSDHNTFEENEFYGNAAGSAIMYSADLTARRNAFYNNRGHRGYGLLLQSVDQSRFEGNRLTRNTTGVYLENSTGNVFRRNRIAANQRGFRLTGSSMENVFTENVVQANLQPVALSGMRGANQWHAEGRGNFWGRRGLVDLDGDGTSELPHHAVDLLAGRREAFPYVALLAASPGLDVLARALGQAPPPSLPAITDAHALMRPPAPETTDAAQSAERGVAVALLLAAWGALFMWRRKR